MKRRLQNMGREELANPVAEALRKAKECEERCCGTCEHYKADNEDGYPLNYCTFNDSSTDEDDYCDNYQQD